MRLVVRACSLKSTRQRRARSPDASVPAASLLVTRLALATTRWNPSLAPVGVSCGGLLKNADNR